MNIVIYARYSSDKQTENSIEGQLKVCYEYAKREKHTVVGEYIDRAISGRSAEKRLEFMRMISDSAKKQFEGVLVYKLDRFARSSEDSIVYKKVLKKNSVVVLSTFEHISNDPAGMIMERLFEAMDEYYSLDLSIKVTRGMRLAAEKSQYTGGLLPLGYKAVEKQILIDEATAKIVREIFKEYASGKTMKDITDYLNAKHIKTAKGSAFNKNSLQSILKNKKYIGTYWYGDIEVKDGMPRIVSDELFEEVQKKMKTNKKASAKAKAKEEYLLTTKLFCGHCKNMMVGVSGTSKTGKKHTYYACKDTLKKKCNKKQIIKQWIENIVVNKCREMLTNENIELIARETVAAAEKARDNSILKILKDQLKGFEKKQANLMHAVTECEIEIVRKSLYEQLNNVIIEKQELEIALAREENKAETVLTASQVKFFLNKLKNADINDIKNRKALIAVFINAIYLYDEPDGKRKITFVLNAGDKPVEITETLLDDIEANAKCSYIDCNVAPYQFKELLFFFCSLYF